MYVAERAQPEQAAWLVVPANAAPLAEVVGEGVGPFGAGERLGAGSELILDLDELDQRAPGCRERRRIVVPATAGQPAFEHPGKIGPRAGGQRPAC